MFSVYRNKADIPSSKDLVQLGTKRAPTLVKQEAVFNLFVYRILCMIVDTKIGAKKPPKIINTYIGYWIKTLET